MGIEITTTKILVSNSGFKNKTDESLLAIVKGVGVISERTLLVHHIISSEREAVEDQRILVIIGYIGNAMDHLLQTLGCAEVMSDEGIELWREENEFFVSEKFVF
jgi:hypothetical protein